MQVILRLTFFAYLAAAQAYLWPSPQLDVLESLRFDVEDNAFVSFIQPCDAFSFPPDDRPTGRSNVADWIRTAYHDMATHNTADGTGGMDGSIRFPEEQARAENAGDGFSNTLTVLTQSTGRYVSVADILVLGALLAIEQCGGPEIPFRGGRIDATEPNLPGVPEPQQDLDSHISSFARQGFSQEEMIGLVACGHTFGGVQHDPFPDIVPDLNDPNNSESVLHFDATNTHFDNNIATEYITGTSQNPLLVGFNDTTNSDKRIFGSDGNATMHSFANSAKLFASTCSGLFARMFDTVPSGVQLSEVITPLPIKPQELSLTLDGDTLKFAGMIRFWNLSKTDQPVQILLDDHIGGVRNTTLLLMDIAGSNGGLTTWYPFNGTADDSIGFLSIDASVGIKSMRFIVDGKLEDQGGIGFPVQDALAFSTTSCRTPSSGRPTAKFDVAVRKGANTTRVYLEQEEKDATGFPFSTEGDSFSPVQGGNPGNPYTIWTANLTEPGLTRYVVAEIDGIKVEIGPLQALIALPPCPGL
ncbi:heme peroxidase [Mycena rebaudengoi]|nr:heme peroxidase [Mycena rebaudengoi]